MGQYRHQVFVFTSGKTCPLAGSLDVFDVLKKGVANAGLKDSIRINKSGCMNQCGHGPMVVVYPEDTWYAAVTPGDSERIVREHLIGGQLVTELRYVAPPGDNKKVLEG